MSSKAERERTKQIQDKCQRLLNEMLKDDDNKYCVDCDAKGPRWASWNIGIFLCIRCAGIHRKLGVHISKVKSVNLDTWTPQQVVSLQQMGNSRARAVYEANLPENFRRPQSEGNLESFIRAKYEHKKFIAREWVAPPLPKVNWDKELEEEAEKLKKKKREVIQSNISSIRSISTPPVIPQPLPKPQSSSPNPSRTSSHTTDLLGLDTPVKDPLSKTSSSDSNVFTSFLSAATESTSNATPTKVVNGSGSNVAFRTEEEDSFFNQSLSATSNKQKPLTKDSILALYGNPGSFSNPILNSGVMGTGFNPVSVNGTGNPLTRSNISQSTLQQNDLLKSGMQFSNAAASTVSNLAFSSNPFYSMAASGGQVNFSSQKGFPNSPVSNGSRNVDLQQAHFIQQMEAMNVNKNNQFAFPPSSHFDVNQDSKKNQVNFGQSISTASNFWQ